MVEGTPVDVLFRDLDNVEHWTAQARVGEFDVVLQSGSITGAPTYLPVGELASCQILHGHLEQPTSYPAKLAAHAPPVWRGQARVCLMFARGYAGLDDVVSCVGMISQAVMCEAHARLAERRQWALNEKRLVADAGLNEAHVLLSSPASPGRSLSETVGAVENVLDVRAADKQ